MFVMSPPAKNEEKQNGAFPSVLGVPSKTTQIKPHNWVYPQKNHEPIIVWVPF